MSDFIIENGVLTKYTGPGGDVVIPEGVTEIGQFAFFGNVGSAPITRIVFPEGVTSIGDGAFYSCSSLASITLPSSVTSIGCRAFSLCRSLSSIVIPNSVTSIGDGAFFECLSLTSFAIPTGIQTIMRDTFGYCEKLTSVTIPGTVTSIQNRAFSHCGLTAVTIPEGVTSIGSSAFSDCVELVSVTLPVSLRHIDSRAFCNCTRLASLAFSAAPQHIGNEAFQNCPLLRFFLNLPEDWHRIHSPYEIVPFLIPPGRKQGRFINHTVARYLEGGSLSASMILLAEHRLSRAQYRHNWLDKLSREGNARSLSRLLDLYPDFPFPMLRSAMDRAMQQRDPQVTAVLLEHQHRYGWFVNDQPSDL